MTTILTLSAFLSLIFNLASIHFNIIHNLKDSWPCAVFFKFNFLFWWCKVTLWHPGATLLTTEPLGLIKQQALRFQLSTLDQLLAKTITSKAVMTWTLHQSLCLLLKVHWVQNIFYRVPTAFFFLLSYGLYNAWLTTQLISILLLARPRLCMWWSTGALRGCQDKRSSSFQYLSIL